MAKIDPCFQRYSPPWLARGLAMSLLIVSGLFGPQVNYGWAATEEQIEAARLKAVEYIKAQQAQDGSWDYPGYTMGATALCTLALIENGLPLNEAVVDKGYRYVKKRYEELDSTYEIALSILLLARVGDRLDKTAIRTLGARLLAGQNEGGGWGYKCPKSSSSQLTSTRRLEPSKGLGDNSCTQFGVLGLWVASRYGVSIDDAMSQVATRFLSSQHEDGGWAYKPPGSPEETPAGSSASMTCAGLFSLTVARANKIRSDQRNQTATTTAPRGEKETLLTDENYAKGFQRVGTFTRGIGPTSPKYLLWSIERLGVLLGLEKLGSTDWFTVGADGLVKTQLPEGCWPGEKGQISDAAFAILFLRKANLGSDISRLLEGEPDQQFAIIRPDSVQRFSSFSESLAAAAAGDTIRIDGNGPFKFSHDLFDKDLTIQAGYGYEPVFELEIGLNKLGLRYRPEKDVEAQHLLQVSAGTLTLEGLRFQFDPPISSKPLPWKVVSVTGGHLRLLNCTFSEANRRGMAAVVVTGPARVTARNCLFVGGRAAIEIVTGGRQEVVLDNCVLYAPTALKLLPNPVATQLADLHLKLTNSCVQVDEAFAATNVKGQVDIESIRTLYRCESLGGSLLQSASTSEGRTWTGSQNIYNVRTWLGANGKSLTSVSSPATFKKFWKDSDVDGGAQTIAWVNPRRNNGFSHGLNPQDWDLSEKSELAFSTTRFGIAAASVGTGAPYTRYREDIRYNLWKRGLLEPEATDTASVSPAAPK